MVLNLADFISNAEIVNIQSEIDIYMVKHILMKMVRKVLKL